MPLLGNPFADPGAERDGIVIVRVFFIVLLVAAALVEIVASFAADTNPKALQFLGLNLILGGAAGLVGGVVGFIFGIRAP